MKITTAKFESRLRVLYLMIGLLGLALSTASWLSMQNDKKAEELLTQTQDVKEALYQIRAMTLQIHLNAYWYAGTGDARPIAEQKEAWSARAALLERIKAAQPDNAHLQNILARYREIAAERQGSFGQVERVFRTEGQKAAIAYLISQPLWETRAQLFALLDEMDAEQDRLIAAHRQAADAANALSIMLNLAFVVTLIVLLLVSFFITRRQMRESEQNIRLLVDGAKDYAIIMLDAVGNVADWNEGARRLKGYAAEEILGQSFTRFYPPEDAAAGKPARLLAQAEREGKCVDEGWRVRKDGTRFFADVTLSALRAENGALLGYSKVTRDITERKAAESRIALDREQQATLRELLELCLKNDALDGMLQDFLDRLLETSWLRLLPKGGIFLMEPEGQALRLVAKHQLDPPIITHCTRVALGHCHCGQAAASGVMQFSRAHDHRHTFTYAGMEDHGHYALPLLADGTRLGVLMLYLPTDFQRNAETDRFMQSAADILASAISRKQSELALAAHQANLEQTVATRTAELERARLEAERLSRVKDTFLATMSHEIRTPMNALLGMLELLTLRPLEAEQARMLGVAQQAGKTLLRIIDDILDFSKIEAGKLSIHPEPASIAELVELTATFFTPIASSKGLRLVHAIDPRISPAVLADRLRLRQILNNLVSNAIKFTERGQVEIKAELTSSRPGMDRVRLSVTDTGLGIDREIQARLFQPFSQASAETTRRYGGSGLGLAICRRLAEMMQGNLELVSAPGQGSTFSLTLELPVIDADLLRVTQQAGRAAAAPERHAPPSVESALTTGQLVLLVDDHATNRDVLEAQLQLLGYASRQAATSKDALRMWEAGRYGLLITDCHMPDMDGYQLAREIRRQERESGRPRMPILAWTANALREAAADCAAAGMDDILVKPADLPTLKAKLQALLPLPRAPAVHAAAPETVAATPVRTEILDAMALRELSGGDRAMENRLLQRFRATNELDVEALTQAIAARDTDASRQLAHRIKGAARIVGARDYAAACEALERAAKQEDWPGIASAWEQVMRSRSALERAIAKEQ